MTAVQFAAPLPACFGATYMYDVAAAGSLLIGNSQTGVSVGMSFCTHDPLNVMQIVYLRAGGTTPCCAYPIVPDPSMGTILATDCTFAEVPVAGVVSHFNADASCECFGNSAPAAPSNPFPQDDTAAASFMPVMSWYASDVDGNLAEYDVYLGTSPSPPLVASGLTEARYMPDAPLALATQHYWRVVARDAEGLESSGPTWTFRTRATNTPPFPPEAPSPLDGEHAVPLNATLTWFVLDLDNDVLQYDVYFGTSPTPPLVAQHVTEAGYSPATLEPVTRYYWRIVASDFVSETSGPTWTFTSGGANLPPLPPSLPIPADAAANVSVMATLQWTCADPDGGAPLVYDVYFGTTSPPPLLVGNLPAPQFSPGPLVLDTQYYWRVVGRDGPGSETSGPEWSFRTRLGQPPAQRFRRTRRRPTEARRHSSRL